jgi:sugar-specific transcriptional regulator TrmB
MANAQELLTYFSITNEEAETYLTLLKLGASTATQISEKAGKNRTAIHFHLKKLLGKNLVQLTKRGRVFVFSAVAPSELAERFDRVTTDFKSIVPQLEALHKIEEQAPRIRVTESRAGYFKVYDEISSLPEGSTFYAIEGVQALRNELVLLTHREASIFYSRMIERKIETRLILTEEAAGLPNELIPKDNLALLKKRILHVRTYPEKQLAFQGLSLLYGNTVAHLFPETNLVITIQHQGIADSFRATFDALFALGKTYSFQNR